MQMGFVGSSVQWDAAKQDMRIAWNIAKFAAGSATVFHQELMVTSMNALATETWGTLRANLNALKI